MDNPQKPMGKGMIVAAWLIALGVLTLFFNGLLDDRRNPNRNPQGEINASGQAQVVLKRNPSGHYVAEGYINGRPVTFFVDTGATIISIPEHIATGLNLERGPQFSSSTANGTIESYATRLERVRLGTIELTNVLAGINPHADMDEVLLGMSFLKYVEFSQRGDELILRQ